MDLSLYITTAQGTDPRASRVVSLTDYAPFPLPAIVLGSRLNFTVYLVNGSGGYNAASGTTGYAPRLALGPRGQTALAYTETFTQIANGWTCTLDLTTTELFQALASLRAGTLALEFSTVAAGPDTTVWGSLPIEILGHVSDPEAGTAISEPTYYTAAQADALFQPLNANLTAESGLTGAADRVSYYTGLGAKALATLTAYGRSLIAAADAAAAKTLLALVKADVGLGNVDNTSDAAKPISTATQTALDLKAPIASPTFTGTVTLPGDPASALQAATKQYVDNLAAGFDVKASVVVATTGNITLSGAQTIDGIAVIAGDRVLVKAQSTPAQNGVYLCAAGAWTRTTDADAWTELPGAFVFVERGSTLADTGWVCTVDAGGTLGTTAVTWSQFSGVGAYQPLNTNLTAEAGLTGAADRVSYYTGLGAKALATFTAFGRTLLAYADAATCFAGIKQAATTTATGVVELATDAEARAGTDAALVPPVSAVNARGLLGDMTRRIADALYSDGATVNRAAYWALSTPGAVAAMPVSIPFEFEVPTSNPAADAFIFKMQATSLATFDNNQLTFRLLTDGSVTLLETGAAYASDQRRFVYGGFRSAYSGQLVRGMIVFSVGDSTTAPLVYVNGVDISASFSVQTQGTPPNWMHAALSTAFFNSGATMVAGRFQPHAPILGALTAAEVLAWTQTGRLPTWCEVGTGNAVNRITSASRNSDFSAGATDWAIISTGSLAVVGSALECTSAAANNLFRLTSGFLTNSGFFEVGRRYRVTYTVTANPSSSNHSLRIGNETPPTALNGGTGTFSQEYTLGVASPSAYIQLIVVSSGAVVTFDNISVYDLGPIFKPVIQPIPVIADLGTNKLAGILTPGITPVTDKRDWVIQDTTATNGNEQILGAAVLDAINSHRIDSWVINNAGTSKTVSLGNASAGTQYASAITAAAGLSDTTLATRFNATTNLWVNSNGTDVLRHTISGRKVD
jgi:hypothetical protein